jgi:ubiquitin-like 1-activating enzyme E1 B
LVNRRNSSSPADKPIRANDGEKQVIDIPRRKKSGLSSQETNGDAAAPQANGHPVTNGKRKAEEALESQNGTKKRSATETLDNEGPSAKRGKIIGPATSDDLIVVDDAADGAIVIDDD